MSKYIVFDTESGYHGFDDMEGVNNYLRYCGYFHLDKKEKEKRFAIYRLL